MLSLSGLTTADVLEVFGTEVQARGGRVADSVDDGRRLFARAILPATEEVRRGDRMKGGVAVKAAAEQLEVYPYLFRLVCSNGAIIAQTVGAWSLADLDEYEPEEVLRALEQQVATCCGEEVFGLTLGQVRTSGDVRVDQALTLMPVFMRVSALGGQESAAAFLNQFVAGGDQSLFGLANAVTAVARDVRDPDIRWNLEELGGGIAVGRVPNGRLPDELSARQPAAVRASRLVQVG